MTWNLKWDIEDDCWNATYKDLREYLDNQLRNVGYQEPTIEDYAFSEMKPNQRVCINYTRSEWEFENILSINEFRNIKLYQLGLLEFDDICDSSSKTKLEYIKDFLCRFNDGY